MSDTKEIADDVLQRIDKVAEKLGVAADKVWEFSVRAKVVNAKRDMVENLVWFFFPVFLAVLGHILLGVKGPGDGPEAAHVFGYVSLLAAAIATGCCISGIITAVARTKTAEYDAYQEVVRDLRRG